MSIEVLLTPEAAEMAAAADLWWTQNRPAAPELLAAELARALELLRAHPEAGNIYRARHDQGVRRLLMRRTKYHVYYRHDADQRCIAVLAVWSAVRGRPPTLQ